MRSQSQKEQQLEYCLLLNFILQSLRMQKNNPQENSVLRNKATVTINNKEVK